MAAVKTPLRSKFVRQYGFRRRFCRGRCRGRTGRRPNENVCTKLRRGADALSALRRRYIAVGGQTGASARWRSVPAIRRRSPVKSAYCRRVDVRHRPLQSFTRTAAERSDCFRFCGNIIAHPASKEQSFSQQHRITGQPPPERQDIAAHTPQQARLRSMCSKPKPV